jgi:integrase
MMKLNGGYAEAYLLRRIQDGIAYESWKKEAAHIGKLENALRELNTAESDTGFVSPGIRAAALDSELRTLAREQLRRGGKTFGHFDDPEAVISGIQSVSNLEFSLVARIQLEGGARCREACRIVEGQMEGLAADPFTGHVKGQIRLTDTKGGKPRTIQISKALYADLEKAVAFYGGNVLHVPMESYARVIRMAAAKAGEALGGTHAFRYCFARRRYKELTLPSHTGSGLTHEAAIQQISWEMGHERASITLLYLR